MPRILLRFACCLGIVIARSKDRKRWVSLAMPLGELDSQQATGHAFCRSNRYNIYYIILYILGASVQHGDIAPRRSWCTLLAEKTPWEGAGWEVLRRILLNEATAL